MHRVVAGCNLWAILFLVVALGLGAIRSPLHVTVGIFAAVFALLAQCVIFALFMGASKLLKEHLARYQLGQALLTRTNAILFPLLGRATVGSLTLLGFALLAGLASSGEVPPLVHVIAGIVSIGVVAAVLPGEVRGFAAMHEVLVEMERQLPEREGGAPAQPPAAIPGEEGAIEPADLRARALVYMGTTLLALVLGYRYISGWPLSDVAVGGAVVLEVACLAAAFVLSRRGRRVAG